MDKILSIIASLFEKPSTDKDPWAAYRNKGGPISSEVGEVMLVITSIIVLACMIIFGS